MGKEKASHGLVLLATVILQQTISLGDSSVIHNSVIKFKPRTCGDGCPEWHFCDTPEPHCRPCYICDPGRHQSYSGKTHGCKAPVACDIGTFTKACPMLYANFGLDQIYGIPHLGITWETSCVRDGKVLAFNLTCTLNDAWDAEWVGDLSCVSLTDPGLRTDRRTETTVTVQDPGLNTDGTKESTVKELAIPVDKTTQEFDARPVIFTAIIVPILLLCALGVGLVMHMYLTKRRPSRNQSYNKVNQGTLTHSESDESEIAATSGSSQNNITTTNETAEAESNCNAATTEDTEFNSIHSRSRSYYQLPFPHQETDRTNPGLHVSGEQVPQSSFLGLGAEGRDTRSRSNLEISSGNNVGSNELKLVGRETYKFSHKSRNVDWEQCRCKFSHKSRIIVRE